MGRRHVRSLRGWADGRCGCSSRRTVPSIPASAGQTSDRYQTRPFAGFDPRECGADVMISQIGCWFHLRSPRVRGRQVHHRDGPDFWSFDPRECGADTPPPIAFTKVSLRSPRVRGRRRMTLSLWCRWLRSPRVRGRRPPLPRRRTSRPSIPASAGQTLTPPTVHCRTPSIPASAGQTR